MSPALKPQMSYGAVQEQGAGEDELEPQIDAQRREDKEGPEPTARNCRAGRRQKMLSRIHQILAAPADGEPVHVCVFLCVRVLPRLRQRLLPQLTPHVNTLTHASHPHTLRVYMFTGVQHVGRRGPAAHNYPAYLYVSYNVYIVSYVSVKLRPM